MSSAGLDALSWGLGLRDVAPLPPNPLWGLHLGWAVVLACLAAVLAARAGAPLRLQRLLALVLALWAGVPGPGGPVHWLALALQMPSLTAVVLCAFLLARQIVSSHGPGVLRAGVPSGRYWPRVGVALGWLLLCDTLGLLPLHLYALGWSPRVAALLVLVWAGPWVVRGRMEWDGACVAAALAAYALTRLPSGNVWDAVLDPMLWLALHLHTWRQLRSPER